MKMLLFASLALLAAMPARAASTEWTIGEGGRVRLVAAEAPDAGGFLDAVIDIELDEGWKTYWLDPGDSGIPPILTRLPGEEPLALLAPAPERHTALDQTYAGYHGTVRLLTKLPAGTMETDLFIGVCKDICVPFSARFATPAPNGSAEDAGVLAQARSALPLAATPDFGVVGARLAGDRLFIEAVIPALPVEPDLFVASAEDWVFGLPRIVKQDGRQVTFSLSATPPLSGAMPPSGFYYVLKAGQMAADGQLNPN